MWIIKKSGLSSPDLFVSICLGTSACSSWVLFLKASSSFFFFFFYIHEKITLDSNWVAAIVQVQRKPRRAPKRMFHILKRHKRVRFAQQMFLLHTVLFVSQSSQSHFVSLDDIVEYDITHVDVIVDDLLTKSSWFNITLPRMTQRRCGDFTCT